MKPFIIYIVEFFLCSGLFMLLYRLLIVRKPNYGLCRKYLIITMLLSAIIPALNVPLYPGQTFIQTVSAPVINAEPIERQDVAEVTTVSETVEEKVVAKAEALTPQLTLNEKFMYAGIAIYLLVALILLALIVRGILLVSKLKRQADVTLKPEYHLAVSDKVETPFSFWRTIFIRTDHDETERRQIISHEASHVAHRHSIEKLLMTVLRSVFWFNPFVWKAEQRLEEVQEWQADRDALSNGYNVESYRLTIIKQLFGCNPELTSGATNSLTKIRFMKMKQKDFQGSKFLQTAAACVLTLSLFLSFGCGQSTKAQTDDDSVMREFDKHIFFTIDKSSITDSVTMLMAMGSDDGTKSYEIYKNARPTETNPACLIASNGVETVESISAEELLWVNEETSIYIKSKRSTLADLKALKSYEYKKIYYSEEYKFVYVEDDKNSPIKFGYQVTIDNGIMYGDLVSVCGYRADTNLFFYSTHLWNVAAPTAAFAIDGKYVSYAEFKQQIESKGVKNDCGLLVYKAGEGAKRFGDFREVVEFRTSGFVHISYFQNNEVPIASEIKGTPASGLRINYARKTSDYKEIAATIAKAKAANKQKGLSTIVDIDGYISDSVYNELLVKCIDTGDADITLVYNSVDHPATVKEEFGLDDDD